MRERVGAAVGEEDGPDGWAPPVSHQQERGRQLGRGPGRGAGERGNAGPPGRKGEREEKFFFFILIFPIEILSRKKKIKESFCFPINHHKRNAPA